MYQEQAWPPGPQRLRDRRESQEEEGEESLLIGGWRITGRVGRCEQWGRTVDPSSLGTLMSHGQGPWCLHGAVFLVKGWSDVLGVGQPSVTLCGRHWIDSCDYEVGSIGAKQAEPMLEAQDGPTQPGSRQRVRRNRWVHRRRMDHDQCAL